MKALTIWQPWASLLIEGAKVHEFRNWQPPKSLIGQRIAIHAAKRIPLVSELRDLHLDIAYEAADGLYQDDALASKLLLNFFHRPERMPLSAVIGTAILGDLRPATDIFTSRGHDAPELWAWPLTETEKFRRPIPARGAQGFWNWEGPTLEQRSAQC